MGILNSRGSIDRCFVINMTGGPGGLRSHEIFQKFIVHRIFTSDQVKKEHINGHIGNDHSLETHILSLRSWVELHLST